MGRLDSKALGREEVPHLPQLELSMYYCWLTHRCVLLAAFGNFLAQGNTLWGEAHD